MADAIKTVEQRLIQEIQQTHLVSLIDDDATLKALVQTAIREALFKDITVPGPNTWQDVKRPSPVVAAAQVKAVELIDGIMKEWMADPETQKALQQVLLAALPAAIVSMFHTHIRDTAEGAVRSGVVNLECNLRERGLIK